MAHKSFYVKLGGLLLPKREVLELGVGTKKTPAVTGDSSHPGIRGRPQTLRRIVKGAQFSETVANLGGHDDGSDGFCGGSIRSAPHLARLLRGS